MLYTQGVQRSNSSRQRASFWLCSSRLSRGFLQFSAGESDCSCVGAGDTGNDNDGENARRAVDQPPGPTRRGSISWATASTQLEHIPGLQWSRGGGDGSPVALFIRGHPISKFGVWFGVPESGLGRGVDLGQIPAGMEIPSKLQGEMPGVPHAMAVVCISEGAIATTGTLFRSGPAIWHRIRPSIFPPNCCRLARRVGRGIYPPGRVFPVRGLQRNTRTRLHNGSLNGSVLSRFGPRLSVGKDGLASFFQPLFSTNARGGTIPNAGCNPSTKSGHCDTPGVGRSLQGHLRSVYGHHRTSLFRSSTSFLGGVSRTPLPPCPPGVSSVEDGMRPSPGRDRVHLEHERPPFDSRKRCKLRSSSVRALCRGRNELARERLVTAPPFDSNGTRTWRRSGSRNWEFNGRLCPGCIFG